MIDQNIQAASVPGEMMAADTASQLFQLAALMLGDEQDAVSLVEETLDKVELDPCCQGSLAYAASRTLLLEAAARRLATRFPGALTPPEAEAGQATCLESDSASVDGEDPFMALLASVGRTGMQAWLDQLPPALRFIFVSRAVAGLDGQQTASLLQQSGAERAQLWVRDLVGTTYRQALCSLASSLLDSHATPLPA